MAIPKFIPNFPAIQAIKKLPIVQAAIAVIGTDMEEHARADAPVDEGKYRDSIHIEKEGEGVTLVADDDKAVYIEYGTEDTPTFAVLRRAVEAAGQELSPNREAE
jgi:pectin methylesterase-like acyl-CoA thioesterase